MCRGGISTIGSRPSENGILELSLTKATKNEKYQRGNQGGVGSPISWRAAGQVLLRRFKFHDVDWVTYPDLRSVLTAQMACWKEFWPINNLIR